MDIPEDIINVPLEHVGSGTYKFYLDDLPDKYVMMGSGVKKRHVVYQENAKVEKHFPEGTGICGRNTVGTEKTDSLFLSELCQNCLKHLENEFRTYMYDEINEEYYNPQKEKI